MRALVLFTLTVSATVAGGSTAAVLGAVWTGLSLPAATVQAAAVVVIAAAALDLADQRTGGLPPLAVRTQVPVAWGRIFDPVTVAMLYGLRLGIGPLTMLNAWIWWAAFGVGISHGPLAGFVVGAAWAITRSATTAAVAQRLDPTTSPDRMAALRAAGPRVLTTTAVLSIGGAAVAVVAG